MVTCWHFFAVKPLWLKHIIFHAHGSTLSVIPKVGQSGLWAAVTILQAVWL